MEKKKIMNFSIFLCQFLESHITFSRSLLPMVTYFDALNRECRIRFLRYLAVFEKRKIRSPPKNPEKKHLIRRKKFNPEKLRRKIIYPEKLRRKKINPERNWRRKHRKIPNPDSEGNIRRNFGEKLLPIQGNSGENGEKVEKMEKIRRRLDPVESRYTQ